MQTAVEGTAAEGATPPDEGRRHREGGIRLAPRDPRPDGRIVHRHPELTIVRASLEAYWRGERAVAAAHWDPEIVWRVAGNGPLSGEHVGAGGIFAYRARLARASGHSWVQRLIALDGGRTLVSAHVRTSAERKGRHLDIPSLLLCEVGALGIRRVTEMPGDQEAWDRFWS